MTPRRLEILRETLEFALAADDRFPARFYEILFARHPELESLFHRNSRQAQVRSFGRKLVAIVDQMVDRDANRDELASLASGHSGYGVTHDMYPMVGEALIETLREACGPTFDAEAEAAWREAYGHIAAAMSGGPSPN